MTVACPLDTPIVVLAMPRTGSSLLMQTLRLLGVPIIGERWRRDTPRSANPRGFFVDPDLLARGLHSVNRERLGDSLWHAAWKIGHHRLVMQPEPGEWKRLVDSRATLLVPMRHPLESALSWRPLSLGQSDLAEPDGPDGFISVTRYLIRGLRLYVERQFRLAERLTEEASALADRCRFVPYELHRQPRLYVDLVCQNAGLTAEPELIEQAVANVTPNLYRYRASDFPDVWLRLYERLPARSVFELVSHPDVPDPWQALLRLRQRLPN